MFLEEPIMISDSRSTFIIYDLWTMRQSDSWEEVKSNPSLIRVYQRNMINMIFIFIMSQLQDLQDLQCPGSSCSPQLGDLMVGRAAQLSASSTCGLDGAQNYCIIGYLEEEKKCFTCDSRLPYNRYSNPNSHRIENIITTFDLERKTKWWQSENGTPPTKYLFKHMLAGVHHVSIQFNLETVFQFSHLVLTFKSFRPAAMLVERSKDFGQTWKVFRYFAEDCSLHFPSVSNEAADSVDDIICDSRYSGSEPSTNGEVVLKALDPIFEIRNPYAPNIQDLITLTNIRVNFTRLFTLGDTLLSRRRRNPLNKYYYALYNMVVRGSCFCNGHASRFMVVVFVNTTQLETTVRDVRTFTTTPPGGQEEETQLASAGDVTVMVTQTLVTSMTFVLRRQDPQRAVDDPQACIPCDCDAAGAHGGGLCEARTGQCLCKENVEGRRCELCKHGFFGLRPDDPAGCQVCRCHALGSVGSCDQLTGRCECDSSASGPLCDRCPEGFWGLGNSAVRCSPCDCDVGGAQSIMCSPEDGQCSCLRNMIGRRCSDPAPGFFLPSLDYFLYEAELAAPLPGGSGSSTDASSSYSSLLNPGVLPECEKYYREKGFDLKITNGRVAVVQRTCRLSRRRRQGQSTSIPLDPNHALQIIPRQRTRDQPVTWTGLGLVRVLEGAGLRFTVDNLQSSMGYQLVIRYETEALSDWLASVSIIMMSPGDGGCSNNPTGSETLILPGNSRGRGLDSSVCLNAGGRYFVDVVFNKQSGPDGSHILIDSIGLIPRIESVQNFCSQSDLESFRHFRCIGLAAELQPHDSLPEVCEALIKSMSARIHNGAVPCRCNVIGSLGPSCSKLGGFCECKPNVMGRCCDTCAPMTFELGLDGCKSCGCDTRGSVSQLCDQVRGQCACRPAATGRRCNHCHKGFWGFPSCRPCECNNLSETCDEETGECVNCREHATGWHCDRCVEGYYGDPVSRQPCQPCLCPDVKNSGPFFATSCQYDPQSLSLTCICQEGHTGSRCNRCSPGFYGDLTLPGARCAECPCNNNIDLDDGNACDSRTGVCLSCQHNTVGPHCQSCKLGYYGNALVQDCKECSCDRRGTEVTRCPLGSSCFCDPSTGQCPCRTGVVGVLCDQCEDGYWNLDGPSGCQPCSCDPVNSFSNICNKLIAAEQGQQRFSGCMGRSASIVILRLEGDMCDGISCDCNLEGTERPSCDPETGECICRTGVTGIFCDECALGYSSAFPACLSALEAKTSGLERVSPGTRCCSIARPSSRSATPIEHVLSLAEVGDVRAAGTVQKILTRFKLDEKRVQSATEALDDSLDVRQEVKHKLSVCGSKGDVTPVEKKITELSVVNLNRQ
ncbi:unnamed protein product, partial [Pleuronectes platessa]